jgi:hypothetical protein
MIYLYIAIALLFGIAIGATLMTLYLVDTKACNHQWHTIAAGNLPNGHYWVDECLRCGQVKGRREVQ